MEIPTPDECRKDLNNSIIEVMGLYRDSKVICNYPKIQERIFLKRLAEVHDLARTTKNKEYLNVFDDITKDFYNFLEGEMSISKSIPSISGLELKSFLPPKINEVRELVAQSYQNSDNNSAYL